MPLLVGTSGWQYRDWRDAFYPPGTPTARWLEYYASRFCTVENNGTFYRLAGPGTFRQWQERTPDGFVMAIKASRYLTHVRRLREPAEPVQRLLAAAAGLGPALGPVLLQLPPTFRADPGALASCLDEFARPRAELSAPVRVCVEFRHDSWLTATVRSILASHDAALCWSDRRGRPLGPLWQTASWGYLRWHEGAAADWPRYGRQALRTWMNRISDAFAPDRDVYAYFNNDQHAAAPADAAALASIAARAGWQVPSPADDAGNAPRGR